MSRVGEDDVWRLPKVVKGANVKFRSGSRTRSAPPLSASAKARLARIVTRTPEVTVKVTGRSRGVAHLKKHLDYITRHGQLAGVTQNGAKIGSRSELRALHDEWVATNNIEQIGRRTPNNAHAVALVLSMPPGTDRDKLESAARSWATDTFRGSHDWVMVRHDDTKHPHVHITVRAVGYDGKRLAPGPADLQNWRNSFAVELRRLGVPAEATPRQARGVVRRPLGLPAQKIEEKRRAIESGDKKVLRAPPARRTPRDGVAAWTATIEARSRNIEEAYRAHAANLANGDAKDQQLAKDILRFVDNLPVAQARKAALADELKVVTKNHPGSARAEEPKIDNRPPAAPKARPAAPKAAAPAPRPAASTPKAAAPVSKPKKPKGPKL